MQPNTHFKELRKKLKLSQVELATQINVSQGTITDIERGRIGVSKRVAKRLQEKFGLDLNDIYRNNERLDNALDQNNENKLQNDLRLRYPKMKGALEALKTTNDKVGEDIRNSPTWKPEYEHTFDILKEHHNKMELYREVANQYSEHSRNLEEYFTLSNQLYGSEQNVDAPQQAKTYNFERLSKEDLERQIYKMGSLKEAANQSSKRLKVALERLREYEVLQFKLKYV